MNKKYLLGTIPSITFLLTMFVSSTFAWFTDFSVNQGNRVQSGNLSVGFSASETIEEGNLSGTIQDLKLDQSPLFNLGNAAQPGDSEEKYLRIRNEGNIAINYKVDFIVTVDSILAEVILFEIQPLGGSTAIVPGTFIDQNVYIGLQNVDPTFGGLKSIQENNNESFDIWRIKMLYSPTSSNRYNDASLAFEVDIRVSAWQFNYAESMNALPYTVRITFDYNFNSGEYFVVDLGINEILPIHQPLRNGYVFRGWYKEPTLNTLHLFDEDIRLPQTYYAKWTQDTSPSIGFQNFSNSVFVSTGSAETREVFRSFVVDGEGSVQITGILQGNFSSVAGVDLYVFKNNVEVAYLQLNASGAPVFRSRTFEVNAYDHIVLRFSTRVASWSVNYTVHGTLNSIVSSEQYRF
jgi:uncharacterized repeat protein (TIGR02543 family)